jgi:nucleotide-binding universal stress UspA family protein
MEHFKRLGVFLNDEPGDDEALAFAGRIAELAGSEKILCVHVRGMEQAATTDVPSEEAIRARILKLLPQAVAARTVVDVHEGTGVREILRSAVDLDLDLLVVGRRLPHDQLAAGSAFTRLARKCPCSVLVVPDGAHAHLGRVVVLVDGSEHSKAALRVALALARADGKGHAQVVVQSVYTISYGYQYAGLTRAESAKQMEQITRNEIKEFLADVDVSGVEFEIVATCSDSVASAAEDLASARSMDVVVMGSRGKTTAPAGLVGSSTERILATCPLPALIVKKKGETVRFLDALFSS